MSDADSRLNDAADRAEAGADIIEQVANGGDAVEVPTASGPRPSLAKWFVDRYAEFYAWAALILADCLTALSLTQSARDAAMLNTGLYVDVATGLVATSDGEFFSVPSVDPHEYVILYKNNSGVAVEQGRYPSAQAAVDAVTASAVAIAQGERAEAEADDAENSANIAVAAVSGSVNTFFAATKAAGDALAAGLGDGATVIVDRDETRGSITVRYTVASGLLISPIDDALATDLANPDKGAAMVRYGDGSVADKLDEIVSGAVIELLVDAKVYTHNEDANSHSELRTRIVSEVSSHVTAEADRAQREADRAESASDAAFVNADVYATIADGRASVAVGEQFQVWSEGDYIRYRKDSASTQTEVARFPSAGRVEVLESAGGGITTSTKNLYNPRAITVGRMYRADGTVNPNSSYRVSEGHPIAQGQQVSISGIPENMRSSISGLMHFWAADGSFISSVQMPRQDVPTSYITETAPAGSATLSVNLPTLQAGPLPPFLQIEISPSPTAFEPYDKFGAIETAEEARDRQFLVNENNLYSGEILEFVTVNNTTFGISSNIDDTASDFIPVEYGKTYVISGLGTSLIAGQSNRRVAGRDNNRQLSVANIKMFPPYGGGDYVVTIDDPEVKFLVIALSRANDLGTYEDALKLRIQVEEGAVSTPYFPRRVLDGMKWLVDEVRQEGLGGGGPVSAKAHISDPVEMNTVLSNHPIDMKPFSKSVGPYGVAFSIDGETAVNASGNNLFVKIEDVPAGQRTLTAMLRCRSEGVSTLPRIPVYPIDVPSGMLDNPDTLAGYAGRYPLDNYCHPSIAYSDAPVAGYKYWLVASILPGSDGTATWEDEDLMVSNDGETWLRVRSLYETAKSYTTTTLRLPPNNFASGARRNGFLPVPSSGQTIEISSPEHNGNPAVERQVVTLTGLPFKHDPAILLDGGYVYVYHSFHMPYNDSGNGTHRFVVCTRSADGINWEAVRPDGSTLPLTTEEASRQIFTKDAQGRYNFMHYAYSTGNSNPEIIKYGEGDYELVYGNNFGRRYKGTAPWNFDFSTSYPIQDVGSGNHPGLLYTGSELLLVNSRKMFRSTNRGETFTELDYYPLWVGSVANLPYKKAMCMGPSGKVLVVDTKRLTNPAQAGTPVVDGVYVQTHRYHKIFLMEYGSVTQLINYAENGIQDAYIDAQVDIVNEGRGTRTCLFRNYIGNTSLGYGVNNPHQKVGLFDYEAREGDVIYMYVTLTARGDSSVSVNGVGVQ